MQWRKIGKSKSAIPLNISHKRKKTTKQHGPGEWTWKPRHEMQRTPVPRIVFRHQLLKPWLDRWFTEQTGEHLSTKHNRNNKDHQNNNTRKGSRRRRRRRRRHRPTLRDTLEHVLLRGPEMPCWSYILTDSKELSVVSFGCFENFTQSFSTRTLQRPFVPLPFKGRGSNFKTYI